MWFFETKNASKWEILNEIVHFLALTARKHPEDQHEIGLKHWEEADEKAEDSERGQENLREEKEKDPEENKLEEATCKFDNITDNLYASIHDDDDDVVDDDNGEHEVGRRDSFLFDRPPLPPREPAATQIYTDLHSFIPGIVLRESISYVWWR